MRRPFNWVTGADVQLGDPLSCALLSVYIIGTTNKLSSKSNLFVFHVVFKGAYFNNPAQSAACGGLSRTAGNSLWKMLLNPKGLDRLLIRHHQRAKFNFYSALFLRINSTPV